MIVRTTLAVVSAAVVVAATIAPAAPETSAPAARDSAVLIQQFLERTEPPLVQYRALRRLEARNERFNTEGWMDVCTELQPEGQFGFRILDEGGSGYIRGRVLRPVLEGEQKVWSTGEVDRGGITSRNYQFLSLAAEELDLVTIGLKPLRRDRMLVDGIMVLTRGDADLIRVEGRLAKNPSFWTTRVEIRRTYARVAGVRLLVTIESVANVRVWGRSTFRMTYEYFAVNEHRLAHDERCAGLAG